MRNDRRQKFNFFSKSLKLCQIQAQGIKNILKKKLAHLKKSALIFIWDPQNGRKNHSSFYGRPKHESTHKISIRLYFGKQICQRIPL